ncbi:MAG: iron-sulfur cluster assembly accessory protein [Chlamydiales bacterium]|nr:iron-sulfur cluster assembly accessory protein [Chlamydiales bacterium]
MIDLTMTIEEIFTKFPSKSQRLAHEMTQAGLHCVGCGAAVWETLEAGMLSHGFEDQAIQEMLKRLNAILAEEDDPTTITLTKRAAEKFKEITKQDGKEGWALRFGDKPGGCGGFEYVLDFSKEASDDDTVITSEGIEIHVKIAMLPRLLGAVIDYAEGLMGSGFKVSNPNVKSSCSCGNSQAY